MGRKDIIFLVVLLVVLATVFYVTLGYPARARFFPLTVIGLCGVTVLVELVKAYLARRKSGAAAHENQNEETRTSEKQERIKFAVMAGWMGGFAFMIWLLGFVAGLPLFVAAYVKTYEDGWRWAIILPVVIFFIVYVGFGLLLQTPLYEGRLFLDQ